MFRSYDHLHVENTSEINITGLWLALIILNLGVCILFRVLDQVQGFPSNAALFPVVVYFFIKIIRYMFRSYDHLQGGNIYIRNYRDWHDVQGFPSNAAMSQ
jgi:hypothetical protein